MSYIDPAVWTTKMAGHALHVLYDFFALYYEVKLL